MCVRELKAWVGLGLMQSHILDQASKKLHNAWAREVLSDGSSLFVGANEYFDKHADILEMPSVGNGRNMVVYMQDLSTRFLPIQAAAK